MGCRNFVCKDNKCKVSLTIQNDSNKILKNSGTTDSYP